MTDEKILIPLALALLGTLFGSYLTAVLKLYLWFPPKAINWITGVLIYAVLVLVGWMPLSIPTAAGYTVCILGGQAAYDKVLRGVWEHVNRWHKGRSGK
ncbi:MAG TPA: hypothetical protein VLH56_11265 [Dissulfurispiraceae bacterium]|nr:hypothetical protein [Dissulfurispiraceae bacterium]